MRLKFAPVVLVALSVAFGTWSFTAPANAWAKGAKGNSEKSGADVPAGFNNQFKWEEGVVGPNDKKLDRNKIAAMQAAARKEDAAHKNEPTVKKAARPAGVGVPASSTLPTMDIEKAAPPMAARPARPHPAAEPPRSRDSLDQLLDSEKETKSSPRRNDGGLGKMLAVSDGSSAASTVASAPAQAHDAASAKTRGKRPQHHR
jgi:hypothetical protein